ncbi:poly [ADP-ribose] polymerase 14-like isoform X2 [Lingula anatina]|uniref:Poly [ADP-ribose] polymerase n=1 Tax=Lingula anatina TaxID=7574 RepID=A0A2R2MPR8_LINAN|nr:poly [ADP-ribose] polymerase 14-like isoform X1 [Lingula anatina]XP_023932231.1 poly [ADP-ribose] polymerase 14-like isoform X2 [Lingula anatina]|eukprot:XP_023932230.1 poly [ADP-ribose] polymerase 14-like isoform X1 [Lingula anatina]
MDAFALIRTWEQDAVLKVQDFFQHYSHEVFQIQPDAWNNVVERIAEKHLVESCDIIVDMDPDTMKITLTGENEMVMLLSNQVKVIHDAEMKAIEREREKIKDDISLDEYKLRLLLALNFLNNMEEQFHDLSTKIDLKNGIISFEGVQADVRNAKLQMYERITTLVEGKVSLSQLMIDFLKFQECQDYLDQCLKSSEVVAVWTFGDKEISLYAQSRDQLETANAIILREVQEKTSELNAESQSLLKSKKWQKMCDSLNKDYPGLLKISSSATHYTIVALKKDMQNILGRIDRFLEENTILTVFEPMEYGRVSYMKNYMIEGLSNITASLKPSVISVEADDTKSKPGILVKGTKDGLKEIMPTIKELSSSVQKCSHPVGKPGMPKFFSEKKGQSLLEGVALRTKTIIEVNQPEETTPRVITGKRENQEAVETRVVKSQVDHSSGKKFLVCKGDMSKYPVDVVVNAANDRLEHTGGLAGALLRAGGKAIQEESKKFLERHGWSRLMEGQIAWTGPGKLPCKLIIHGVGPMWEGDKAGKERLLKEVVYKAFEKANQDGFKSIAFPAISSGIFGYPVDKSTRTIVEAADMSCSENPSSSLKEIHFVDTSDSTVDLFSKAVHSVLGISSQFGQPKTRYSGSPTLREDTRGDDNAQWQDPDDIDTDDELQAAVAGARGSRRTTKNTDFQPGPSPDSVETAEGITVTLVKGQLAQQQVDVIVNTTHQSLNLSNGAVSKSILMTAGPQIQQECSNKYPGGVRFGDVAPTRGYGRLQCKMVYHGACCNYDGGKGQSEQILRQFIQNCLNELSRTGFLSIAFPAIGTGNLGFPKDLVAKAMFEEIKNFSSANSHTSLKDVLFVIYEKDFPLIKAFEDELQRVQGKGGMGAKPKRKRKSKAGTSEGGGSLYTNLTSHTPGGYQMKIGKICVQIQKDDITKENVGAIVNSSNPTLDLSMGGVSKAIVNSGGSAILDECRKKGQTMGGLALTGAGKLKCKYIIHFDAQMYFYGKWKEAVIKCLEMAESLGVKSVAFPALGTGALGYNNNPESIASDMLEGIADFYINVNPINVMLVRITLFQPHLLPIFQKVMKNKHGTPLKDNRGIFKKMWDTVRRHSWKGSEVLEREKKVLVLDIYAKDKKSSDAAVQGIEDIVRDEMEDRMITDDEIARFSPEQVDRLRDLEKKLDVQMNIEILGVNRVNRIRIQGHKQDVAKVVEEYHKILRELKDHDLKIAEAEACAKEVMWMYIDGGKNYQYDMMLNADIEKAYQANKRGRYKYKNEDGQTLEINFVKMEEIMSGDTTSGIKVLRKNLKEMQNLPNHWSPMPMGQSQVSIPIDMSTREYRKVMTKLMKTSQGSINQIFKIERIQNPTLYKSYMVKKEDMETRNPGLQNVRELFHGTSEETLPSINNTGFNRSYCGKNATMYGRGVYFATQSVYAARDQYARPNSNGERHIYLAKVLTGDYTAGNQSLIVPPLKQGSQHFDSVVDDPNNPGIFVIFSDNQAYPEYLITFN